MEPQFKDYPGTNNVDMQGPSAGQIAGQWVRIQSDDASQVPKNVTDIRDFLK